MKIKLNNLLKITLVSGLLVTVYYPTFVWMVHRWMAKDGYYSHGFLVPLVCLVLVWMKKRELQDLRRRPQDTGYGLGLIVVGVGIHLISMWWRIHFTSAISMIIVLAGLVLYFFGRWILRKLLFPVAFLIFMVPMPLVAIANISLKMKLFVAQAATIIVNRLSMPAIRDGSIILMRNSYVEVGAPCSGLKSLISLLALSALFAYVVKGSHLKKSILFLAAVPIAILSNMLRIVLLCIISEIYGMKVGLGFFHDFSGFLVFAIALVLLIGVNKALQVSELAGWRVGRLKDKG